MINQKLYHEQKIVDAYSPNSDPQKPKTEYYHNSSTVSEHRLWNELPDHIKHGMSLPSVNSSLYKHMVECDQF